MEGLVKSPLEAWRIEKYRKNGTQTERSMNYRNKY